MLFPYKLLQGLLLPPMLVLVGMLLAIWLMSRNLRWAKRVLLASSIVYYLLSIEPTAALLLRDLERRVPSRAHATRDMTAILVLAGGAQPSHDGRPAELSAASAKRLWRAIQLYREGEGRVPILYAGGPWIPSGTIVDEPSIAASFAVLAGVPAEDFWLETHSRTTEESAAAVRALLHERFPSAIAHRMILVTSAWHIRRAVEAFRAPDVSIIPVGVDFSAPRTFTSLSFLPSAESFGTSVRALREWLGILVYRAGRLSSH